MILNFILLKKYQHQQHDFKMPLSFIFSFFPEIHAIQSNLILNVSLLLPDECSGGYNLKKYLLAIILVGRSKIIRKPAVTCACRDNFHVTFINPLNAELIHICHLLILLGDSTFMGPYIVSIFQYTRISNKMQPYTVYLYLETALHVSVGNSNHHQERIQLYLQHLVFVTPLLLSAPIVEELEQV
jgi:hypothetical protein